MRIVTLLRAEKQFGVQHRSTDTHNTWTSLGWLHDTTRKIANFKLKKTTSVKTGGHGPLAPPVNPPMLLSVVSTQYNTTLSLLILILQKHRQNEPLRSNLFFEGKQLIFVPESQYTIMENKKPRRPRLTRPRNCNFHLLKKSRIVLMSVNLLFPSYLIPT